MKNNTYSFVKTMSILAAIATFLLLSYALIISHESPAKGYELDIYSSTPLLVWVFICISFVFGITLMFFEGIPRFFKTNKIWIFGFIILVMSRIILLCIPYIRGYVSWWGDNISYLGQFKDILSTGHVGSSNIYPLTHILLAEVAELTGIQANVVAILSTAFISVLSIFFIYLLSSVIFRNKKQRLLVTLIASGILLAGQYNMILTPNGWSILLLPFLFYLYFKQSSFSYHLLLVIILLIYPIFHPLSCSVVIVALFILAVCRWFFPKLFSTTNLLSTKIYSVVYLLFETILFAIWIYTFPSLTTNVRSFWQQITLGIGSGQLSQLGENLNKINVHGINFVILLFKIYGAEIILMIVSAIGIVLLLTQIRQITMNKQIQNIIPLSAIFLFFTFLYAAYLVGLPGTNIGAGQFDRRFLGYVEMLIPIFVAFTFYKMPRFRNPLNLSILWITLIIASILSILSLYPSPYIQQPNLQITKMDMAGMTWFIEMKDQGIGCVYISTPPSRFSDAILGYEKTHLLRPDISGNIVLADHFGYSEQNSLGTQYPLDYYLPITKCDRILYTTVWKNVGRYDNIDFVMLENDSSVSKLYSNDETGIYYIKSTSP